MSKPRRSSKLEKILEKVRKLLRLPASTTPHESAAAAAAADRLIHVYRLSQAEVDRTASSSFVERTLFKRRAQVWERELAWVLCDHYGCAGCVFLDGPVTEFRVNGTVEDIALLRELFDWLREEAVRLCAASELVARCLQLGFDWATRVEQVVFSRIDWLRGFVDGVSTTFKLAANERRGDGNSTALVVLESRAEQARKAMDAKHPKMGTCRPPTRDDINRESYLDGYRRGGRVAATVESKHEVKV